MSKIDALAFIIAQICKEDPKYPTWKVEQKIQCVEYYVNCLVKSDVIYVDSTKIAYCKAKKDW